eukprot:GFYU01009100.1.p1 GENE.GFYU01009100.1~~GFYU01009100.1.p1  ORF type:complete len:603 (+),score=195.53 GFYU01009100.1:16-1824(+)
MPSKSAFVIAATALAATCTHQAAAFTPEAQLRETFAEIRNELARVKAEGMEEQESTATLLNTLRGASSNQQDLFDTLKEWVFPATAEKDATSQDDAPLSDTIDEYIKNIMDCMHLPSAMLSVVSGGEVVYAKGHGVRDVTTGAPVDENTLFGIGSTSKAFTATLLGMMADDGLVDFDASVTDVYPEFHLKDMAADMLVTPRDLMSHRTGLPRHDMVIMSGPAEASREDLIGRLKHLQANYPIRAKWQYNNMAWMSAGKVASVAYSKKTGKAQTWEEMLHDLLLGPLGMDDTAANFQEAADRTDNLARPAIWNKETQQYEVLFPWEDNIWGVDKCAPAGAINTSAKDIGKWLKLNLQSGKFDGKQLISAERLNDIHSPHMLTKSDGHPEFGPPAFPVSLMMNEYGLGWEVSLYRGMRMVWHNGGTLGHTTLTVLFPDYNIAVATSTATLGDAGSAQFTLILRIVDKLLGLEPWLDDESSCTFPCKWLPNAPQCKPKAPEVGPESPVSTDMDLQEFEGTYFDLGYGKLELKNGGDAVNFAYNKIKLACTHDNHDVFNCTPSDVISSFFMPKTVLEFSRDLKGDVSGVNVLYTEDVDYNIAFHKQ